MNSPFKVTPAASPPDSIPASPSQSEVGLLESFALLHNLICTQGQGQKLISRHFSSGFSGRAQDPGLCRAQRAIRTRQRSSPLLCKCFLDSAHMAVIRPRCYK